MKYVAGLLIGFLISSPLIFTSSNMSKLKSWWNPTVQHYVLEDITSFTDGSTDKSVTYYYKMDFKNPKTKQVGSYYLGNVNLEIFADLSKEKTGYLQYDSDGWKNFNHKLHLPEKD